MTTPSTRLDNLDKVGATTSLLCAIHCAAMPLLVTLLPVVGLSFLAHENTEWALLLMSAFLGVLSLCWGFRMHRSRRALAVLSVGLLLLFGGRVLEEREIEWGVVVLVAGGIVGAASHFFNLALCRACRTCQHSHSPEPTPSHRAQGEA